MLEDRRRGLSLKLFGPFEALLNGAPLPEIRKRSGEHLLAILALHPDRSVQNTWLANALWPETGSLDSLRQSLVHLRQALGSESYRLKAETNTVSLGLAGAFCDVAAFDALIDAPNIASLKCAVDLYKGPLLQGWDHSWVRNAREKRKETYLEALKTLAGYARAERDYTAAARYLRRFVNARPSLEAGWCELMDVLALGQERIEAMEIYRKYQDYLYTHGQGNLDPPARMTALLGQIQKPPSVVPELLPDFSGYEPVGGAVPLHSPFYIVREADAQMHAAITRRDSILLIKGPRQIGKTSLLARGLEQARQQGAKVVLTDFQKLAAAELETKESFFLALAQSLADQLDLTVVPGQIQDASRAIGANFERYLRREVLGKMAAPLVWGLDEADRLFPCAFKDDVFGLFRAWHNERSLDPNGPWERLTLALAYATEAHLFISDLNQSPFNVGTRVALEDLTREQVAELNRRYDSPLRSNDEVTRLFALVGGHPYLVRRGLHAMQTSSLDIAAVEAQAERDDGIFGAHLERLLVCLMQDAELTDGVRDVLRGQPCPTRKSFLRLQAAGVLAGDSEQEAHPRCHLYQIYLTRHLL